MKYNHKKIEKKWQKAWEQEGQFTAHDFSKKPKYYCLVEFPYPSGDGLHTGHPRSYTALDIISRKRRMEGFEVLYPMGFDAFGLPAENYAIKTGIHPKIIVRRNIKNFTRQMKSIGFSFDWQRSFSTTDEDYYKWTQWIFLKMFENGLAYKTKFPINWCPNCKIGLANEEVVAGKCERCGSPVEKKEKEQWLLKITKYAERLIKDLDNVNYIEQVKVQQKNWIGRSEGALIKFKVKSLKLKVNEDCLEVFTTRPDTLFGATFMVIAPEHKIISNLKSQISNINEVTDYVEKAKRKSDLERTDMSKEKTGVEIEGIKAVNPLNGKEIPIFVADYVLTGYGTGAIMAVPAHDQRDFEFAKKYNLPIQYVISPEEFYFLNEKKETVILYFPNDLNKIIEKLKIVNGGIAYEGDGILINSEFLDGLKVREAIKKMTAWLEEKKIGKKGIQYKLRDWVFSRQHYWGEPIPLVFCEHCKNKKQKVLLIHGFEGSGEGNWFPWIKQELEKKGFEVFAPSMSTGEHPVLSEWMRELKPYIEKVGEDDIVIGHSLGSKAAIHLIEKTKKKIGSLYLIASAIGEVEGRDWERLRKEWQGSDVDALRKFWEEPMSLDIVDQYVGKKIVILSDDDPYIKRKTHDIVPWHWDFRLWSGLGHLTQSQIPELLEAILESKHTGWVGLPEDKLPLTLPNVKKYEPTDTGESPLAKMEKWVNTKCPRCGGRAKRETDVMPNWAGSDWYFLRYCDPKNNSLLADPDILKYWMPVDWYNGGLEHTTLHLLYSRFVYKFLWDIGAVPKEIGSEPYKKRTSHGMILGEGGEKMSKSRGNVVNPDDIIKEFGADVLRMYEMFIGPFNQAVSWDTKSILGIKRFLDRVWGYASQISNSQFPISKSSDKNLLRLLHHTIKKVGEDIESMGFNTAVSALMIFFNELQNSYEEKSFEIFLILLSPFAPHITEEIWREILGKKKSIFNEPWPKYDSKLLVSEEVQIVIQINGRVRDKIIMSAGLDEKTAVEKALQSEKVSKFALKENIIKTIYVKNKLLNIVVK